MDCSPPGSSVHGILLARMLEWAAISSFRGSSELRTEPTSLTSPALAGRFFTTERPGKPKLPLSWLKWSSSGFSSHPVVFLFFALKIVCKYSYFWSPLKSSCPEDRVACLGTQHSSFWSIVIAELTFAEQSQASCREHAHPDTDLEPWT